MILHAGIDVTMVYYLDWIDAVDDLQLSRLLPYVSADRMQKAERYRFAIDRTQSVLAFLLLRASLYREHGFTAMPQLGGEVNHKPYLTNLSGVCFSLSHCKKGVACGISGGEIGVDIQEYVPYRDGIAEQFLSRQEQTAARLGNADREFTRLWTLKESYGKFIGYGICYDMPAHPALEGVEQGGGISKCWLYHDFALAMTAETVTEPIRLTAEELTAILQKLDRR